MAIADGLPCTRRPARAFPAGRDRFVVGSWNARGHDWCGHAVEALTRNGWRAWTGLRLAGLLGRARSWRNRRYDVAVNFEPDIRSNLLLAASGAAFTAGYASGGGGPLLERALSYDIRAHTTDNARALVASVFARQPTGAAQPVLAIPDAARRGAAARLGAGHGGPVVGVHVSGGRRIGWEP